MTLNRRALLLCLFLAPATPAPALAQLGDTVATPTGLRYVITARGDGPQPTVGNFVLIHYTGRLADGTTFYDSRKRGAAAAERMVRTLKPGFERRCYVSEDELNALGYEYLGNKMVPKAIAVFKINAAQFPRSANVYDSLGEAYMKGGNANNAIGNYRQSLRLDPTNKNAAEMLRQLGVSSR